MRMLKFKKLREDAILPERAHPSDSGFDLFLPGGAILEHEPKVIMLGFAMELPPGHEGQIRPRSSSALNGILVQFGTIDQDYRGEIGVVVWSTFMPLSLDRGHRIAQLVVARLSDVFVQEVDELGGTDRGEGGFGSTGR